MTLKELNDFFSTESRKQIFMKYVFTTISPSELVSEMKIPFSTVDRITQLLKAHGILLETPGKDMREKKYTVDFESWVKQNLKFLGIDFLDTFETRRVMELMKDKIFFTLSYLFINPDFILEFFEDPLKISGDIPFLFMMEINRADEKPALIPTYILLYLEFSPIFKKLVNEIENKTTERAIQIINKGVKKYTPVKDLFIDNSSLLAYEKNRAELLLILRRAFEKKIQKMSIEMVAKTKEK